MLVKLIIVSLITTVFIYFFKATIVINHNILHFGYALYYFIRFLFLCILFPLTLSPVKYISENCLTRLDVIIS